MTPYGLKISNKHLKFSTTNTLQDELLGHTPTITVRGTMHQFKVHTDSKDINLRLLDRYFINRELKNGMNSKVPLNDFLCG